MVGPLDGRRVEGQVVWRREREDTGSWRGGLDKRVVWGWRGR